MTTDTSATAGTVVGWISLALGIVIWSVLIPLTASAFFFADQITIEAGFATFGAIASGVVGGIGVSAIVHSEHKSGRGASWIYLGLVVAAVVVTALLNTRT